MRRDATALAVAVIAATIGGATLVPAAGGDYGGSGPAVENPCHGEYRLELLCPNLRISSPEDVYVTSGGGKVLLHAQNDIRSRGEGPLELRGKRIPGTRQMSVRQVIHTTDGERRFYPTLGRLVFYHVRGYGSYWKFHHAARFELWTIGPAGSRLEMVRRGPKLNYCFRDLVRTKASARSPAAPVYPGCSQDPDQGFRTLGTSVGWSDIYPADYWQNWINVRGLRGCFAFVLRVDPLNLLYENDEGDNSNGRHVRLPVKGGRIRSCHGPT